MFRIIKRLPWIAIGAAVAWFLDPRSGAERRREARERISGLTARAEPVDDTPMGATRKAAA